MSRRLTVGLLVLVFAAQLAVPLFLIGQNETWRAGGELIRLPARPVDPYDAFRGRYLLLEVSGPEAASLKTKVFRFYLAEDAARAYDPAMPTELEGYVSGGEFHPLRLHTPSLP